MLPIHLPAPDLCDAVIVGCLLGLAHVWWPTRLRVRIRRVRIRRRLARLSPDERQYAEFALLLNGALPRPEDELAVVERAVYMRRVRGPEGPKLWSEIRLDIEKQRRGG